MDISSLAGMAVAASQANTREALNIMMVKQANEMQQQLVDMLAAVAAQPQSYPNYTVSVYG